MIFFRYKEDISSKSGKGIKRPVADISLKSVNEEWIEFHPYIDSGADVTLIPLSLGKLLGLTINEQKIEQIGGIRGQVPVIYKLNSMRVGDIELQATIAWALIEDVPPLLGRTNVFDLFEVTFKQREGIIIFKTL